MATKKTAPKVTLPYDRKLITAWKNVGEKAAEKLTPSLAKVIHAVGTWEALAATFEAGKFPFIAVWNVEPSVADHTPTRYAAEVLATRPKHHANLLYAYTILAGLLGRALREDPHSLDSRRDHDDELVRQLVEVALAEAGVIDAVSKPTRKELAPKWVAGGLRFPALRFADGAVERVLYPSDEVSEAVRETATRIFGRDVAAIVAAAHRRRIEEHTAVAGQFNVYALYPEADALAIAAPALTPTEVCAFQSRFVDLSRLSDAWTVDQMLDAAAATRERNRPDSYVVVNSLAVLAIARDPSAAPRAEPFLNLADLTNQASPSVGIAFEALMRADPAWKKRFALDVVFAPSSMFSSVFIGPIAVALLASVDAEAAERVAIEHRENLDYSRLNGCATASLLRVVEGAGPEVRLGLATPLVANFLYVQDEPPTEIDALIRFDGSTRDLWLTGFFPRISPERELAILKREVDAGRGERLRQLFGSQSRAALQLDALGV